MPQKESYRVVYRASFSRELVADAAYTDGNGNQVELKEISGNWEKTVILKSGTHAQLTTFAKAKTDARGEYKIMVDGKVVSEYILTGKRLKYNFDFDLP